MITLYDYELSGNCYKLRLFLSILELAYDIVPIDFYPGREHKSAAFLAFNPRGQLPVLIDGGEVLTDSQSILVHLARTYDGSGLWYPSGDTAVLTEIEAWHGFAEQLTQTVSAARLTIAMSYPFDLEKAQAGAHTLFRRLDEHLWFAEREGQDWLCRAGHPTTADIACFPYIALSEEGGVSRQDYPAIRRWLDRVKRIKGFVPMSGVFPAGPAA